MLNGSQTLKQIISFVECGLALALSKIHGSEHRRVDRSWEVFGSFAALAVSAMPGNFVRANAPSTVRC